MENLISLGLDKRSTKSLSLLPENLDQQEQEEREEEDPVQRVVQLQEHIQTRPFLLRKRSRPEDEQEAEEEEQEEPAPFPEFAELPIRTFSDHANETQNSTAQAWYNRLDALSRLSKDAVPTMPLATDVLRYVARIESQDQPLYFQASQRAIVGTQRLKFPVIPIVTRAWTASFMIEPLQVERLCRRMECSAEHYYGFRLAAMDMPTHAPQSGQWCYICHLVYTNTKYWKRLNTIQRKREERQAELGHPLAPEEEPWETAAYTDVIQYFGVMVDRIGEYAIEHTLCGDTIALGIFVPFPIFHRNNFVVDVDRDTGRNILRERDHVVFRASQTMSGRNNAGGDGGSRFH